MSVEKVKEELIDTMVDVINSDVDTEAKRAIVAIALRGAAEKIDASGVFECMDKVIEKVGGRDKLREIMDIGDFSLTDQESTISQEMADMMAEIEQTCYQTGTPIFFMPEGQRPVVIMPMYCYNAMVQNERLQMTEDRIKTKIRGKDEPKSEDPSTEKVQ